MKTDHAYSSRCNQYNSDLALCDAEDSDATSVTATHSQNKKEAQKTQKEACSIVWAVGCCIVEVSRSVGHQDSGLSTPPLRHDGWYGSILSTGI